MPDYITNELKAQIGQYIFNKVMQHQLKAQIRRNVTASGMTEEEFNALIVEALADLELDEIFERNRQKRAESI